MATTTSWTWFLINAPAPLTIFHDIVWKIPSALDTMYNMVSDPIVLVVIIILVVALFIYRVSE